MTIRCPRRQCGHVFDTDFNKLIFDKDKGYGYTCPFCYHHVGVGRWRDNPLPRQRPHMSKKERRRQREATKPTTSAKESA
jgi:hypothetical protein